MPGNERWGKGGGWGGGMERCNVSLSSLFCGFPLGPDALFMVLIAAQHCFVTAVVLGFPCAECVYNGSDTTTTPEHSSNLNRITSGSHTHRGTFGMNKKKVKCGRSIPAWGFTVCERTQKWRDCYSGLQKLMSGLYVKLMSVQRSFRGHRSGYRVCARVRVCART